MSEIVIEAGTVFWLTGLSGAGKTTIGIELYQIIKNMRSNVVFLDGDDLRSVLCEAPDYSLEARKRLAMQYSGLCRLLSNQGIDVICATISMFKECWEWNRNNIDNYKEIYIKVPMDVLEQRDQKRLYSQAKKGITNQVIGVDIPFETPDSPDMVLSNIGNDSPFTLASYIYKSFSRKENK